LRAAERPTGASSQPKVRPLFKSASRGWFFVPHGTGLQLNDPTPTKRKIENMKNMKTLLQQRILTMRHNKFFSPVIALCAIAVFTIGSVPSTSASTRTPVTITAVYDFSTFPDVTGTFTTTGGLTISGPSTMHVGLNENGVKAHCVVYVDSTRWSYHYSSAMPICHFSTRRKVGGCKWHRCLCEP
jgi:hypothetical protein